MTQPPHPGSGTLAAAPRKPTLWLAPRAATILALAVGVQGLVLAWGRRFIQDDAFISFNYARALVDGHGLTWFGERVEGYTNFLWVTWIGLGMRCGADPIRWSWATGLVSYAVLLHATWQLGLRLCGAPLPALVALALLVTNATVAAFATSGMETMLQAALLAQAVLQLVRLRDAAAAPDDPRSAAALQRHALRLSWLLGAAVLTRLDSALPAAFLGGDALLALWQQRVRIDRSAFRRILLGLVLPGGVLVGAWLAWKLAYYGDLLPNTYYAKVRLDFGTLRAGALYIWRFLDAYLLWPFVLAAAVAWSARRLAVPRGAAHLWGLLAILTLGWWGYLALVGGDFMEFRMLVPVQPYVCLLLAFPACTALSRYRASAGAAMALLLAFASAQHARRFHDVTPDRRLDSIAALADFYTLYPDGDWGALGRELQEQLAGTNAVLALHAVGAIPYSSGLRTVDMYGLTDRDIARNGNPAPATYRRPGHQRQATLAQLRQRGVNLVLGHPTIDGRGLLADPRLAPAQAQWVRDLLSFSREPLGPVRLVAMPLRHRAGALRMWVLETTPGLEAVIQRNGWESTTIDASR